MSALTRETHRRSPTDMIAEWWREWTRNLACPSDLAICSDAEVDRMACEMGLSSDELSRLVSRGPHAADLLFRRMIALDFDRAEVAEVQRATFLDLERVCSNCDCKGRCKRDLARRPNDAVWEDYCPNVATLKMLDALPWASRREW